MAFAGQFNEPIEIYDFVKTKSKIGVISEVLSKTYSTRAKVGHISGSRTVINGEIATPYSKNFVVRIYVPCLDTSWIKYQDKYYRVTSIDKDREKQWQVVTTSLVLDYEPVVETEEETQSGTEEIEDNNDNG